MKSFLLKQQFPDHDKALRHAEDSLEAFESKSNHGVPDTLVRQACACPHLREVLPDALQLDYVETSTGNFVLANPVHSLHLTAHLDAAWLKALKEEPIMYGEEQERMMAVRTPGLAETFHPWLKSQTLIPFQRTRVESETDSVKASASVEPPPHSSNKDDLEKAKVPIAAGVPVQKSLDAQSTETTATLADVTSSGGDSISCTMLPPDSLTKELLKKSASGAVEAKELSLSNPETSLSNEKSKLPLASAPLVSETAQVAIPASIPSSAGKLQPPVTQDSIASPSMTHTSNTATSIPKPISVKTDQGLPSLASPAQDANHLSDTRFWSLQAQEDQIRILHRALLSKRTAALAKSKTSASISTAGSPAMKKRKAESKAVSISSLSAWKHYENNVPTAVLTPDEEDDYHDQMTAATRKVEKWMEHYRLARESYWQMRKQSGMGIETSQTRPFGAMDDDSEAGVDTGGLLCRQCFSNEPSWMPSLSGKPKIRQICRGDQLMRCLECTFVGCGPSSTAPNSEQHILRHFLLSNHKLGVTCGREARVYCFQCGDFVYHEIFDHERDRVDLATKLPWQAWKPHPVQRSFDALQFMRIQDQGIFWRGMIAAFPPLVPIEHVRAAQFCRLRQVLFSGEWDLLPLMTSSTAKSFARAQWEKPIFQRGRILAPVGMYNLGNTCYQSAVLQCLVNCAPVQKYFLEQVGHHHSSCQMYRKTAGRSMSSASSSKSKAHSVCLACEIDKILLDYVGSSMGIDVRQALLDVCLPERRIFLQASTKKASSTFNTPIKQGEPLAPTEMLAATWVCKGMEHLAGYEQRDAHEFLHGFLEALGKHTQLYREKMYKMISTVQPSNALMPLENPIEHDFVKKTFEGKLRSVLICQECGSKRTQLESFLSISLPLSSEVQRVTTALPGDSDPYIANGKLSVERCLRHFTLPELLSAPIDCPSCKKKTQTKKQHVVSKLPNVLCLHLKRFDAAQNKKIEDFVAFPARNLNMGPYLPHWCEVTSAPEIGGNSLQSAQVMYSLFATVNHFGNLQSGHYVANVKVNEKWFHCNDAHVAQAGIGIGEREVLQSNAYLLFYIRSK